MTRKKAGRLAVGIAPDGEEGSPVGELIPGWAEVCNEVHKSRTQLWRDIRAGLFPPPIETGGNSIAWIRGEIEEWKRTRPRRTYRAAKAV
jgi:predicted DNA-binding transcriptional regulator AlpA